MNRRTITTPRLNAATLPRLAAVLLVLLACLALSAPAFARDNEPARPAKPAKTAKPPKVGKLAKTGEIQITTPNHSYEVLYDGNPSGFTPLPTTKDPNPAMVIDLVPPGRHTIEVLMENGTRWTREVEVLAGHRHCLGVTYKPPTKHCWDYPLTANILVDSRNGDIITLKSNVVYNGDIAPTYLWTVSSPNVKFINGSTSSSPEITISTAEASGKVRVTLGVSVDDGSGNPGCMKDDFYEVSVCTSTPITPTITVSPASSYFKKGDRVTFTPHVSDYTGTRPLNYAWATEPSMPFTVNDQDHSITVNTTGLPQLSMRAILIVKELSDTNDTACPPVEKQAEIEAAFDDCTNCTMNDVKARLDNLGIAVQGEPGSKALVYVHGPLMKARTVGAQVHDYLVSTRGLGSNQVYVEPIADSDVVHIELWVWKSGNQQPPPNLSYELKRPQPPGIQHIPRATQRRSRSTRR